MWMAEKDEEGRKEYFSEWRIGTENNDLPYINVAGSLHQHKRTGGNTIHHLESSFLIHLRVWWRMERDTVMQFLHYLFIACYSFQAFINVKHVLMKKSAYTHSTATYLFQKSHWKCFAVDRWLCIYVLWLTNNEKQCYVSLTNYFLEISDSK